MKARPFAITSPERARNVLALLSSIGSAALDLRESCTDEEIARSLELLRVSNPSIFDWLADRLRRPNEALER